MFHPLPKSESVGSWVQSNNSFCSREVLRPFHMGMSLPRVAWCAAVFQPAEQTGLWTRGRSCHPHISKDPVVLSSQRFLPVFIAHPSSGFLLLMRTGFPIKNMSRVIFKSLFTGPCVDEKSMRLWDSVGGRQMTSCDTKRRRREGELPGGSRRVIVLRRGSPVWAEVGRCAGEGGCFTSSGRT